MSDMHQTSVGVDLDTIQSNHPVCCAVCDGRFTVDRLLELALGPPITMERVPLCLKHYMKCEEGIQDWRNIKSPPCIINVSAVGTGINPGIFG